MSDHDQSPLLHRNVINQHSFIYSSVLHAREIVIAVMGELTEQRVGGNTHVLGNLVKRFGEK